MQSRPERPARPATSSRLRRGRLALVLPLLALGVPLLGLSAPVSALLAGGLVAGAPEVLLLVAAALLRRSATGTAGIHMGSWAVPWHQVDAVVVARARVIVASE